MRTDDGSLPEKTTTKESQILNSIFNWSVLKNDSEDGLGNITRAILRVYKDANHDYKSQCSKATLQSKIAYKHVSDGEIHVAGNKMSIQLANGRNYENIDLTPSFKALWPIPDVEMEVQVSVILKSDCPDGHLPIKIINIDKLTLQRYKHQPILILKIATSSRKFNKDLLQLAQKRRSRDTILAGGGCRKVNRLINFRDLGMKYVVAPPQYDAGECVGLCDVSYFQNIQANSDIQPPNNYARVTAAQAYRIHNASHVCCN